MLTRRRNAVFFKQAAVKPKICVVGSSKGDDVVVMERGMNARLFFEVFDLGGQVFRRVTRNVNLFDCAVRIIQSVLGFHDFPIESAADGVPIFAQWRGIRCSETNNLHFSSSDRNHQSGSRFGCRGSLAEMRLGKKREAT